MDLAVNSNLNQIDLRNLIIMLVVDVQLSSEVHERPLPIDIRDHQGKNLTLNFAQLTSVPPTCPPEYHGSG